MHLLGSEHEFVDIVDDALHKEFCDVVERLARAPRNRHLFIAQVAVKLIGHPCEIIAVAFRHLKVLIAAITIKIILFGFIPLKINESYMHGRVSSDHATRRSRHKPPPKGAHLQKTPPPTERKAIASGGPFHLDLVTSRQKVFTFSLEILQYVPAFVEKDERLVNVRKSFPEIREYPPNHIVLDALETRAFSFFLNLHDDSASL